MRAEEAYGMWVNEVIRCPPRADKIFFAHFKSILWVASELRRLYGAPDQVLYRGILCDEKYIAFDGKLNASYIPPSISFSEDKAVAEEFADIDSFMSAIIKMHGGPRTGYIIEHRPAMKEILFYWKWMEPLGILKHMTKHNQDVLTQQKEVVIVQSGIRFAVTKYKRSTHGLQQNTGANQEAPLTGYKQQ